MEILLYILIGAIALFGGYAVIPNYIARNHSKKVTKKFNTNDNLIALTFDDGPDAKYTKEVLNILEEHDIKGTFFLVANKIEQNREIVNKMKREGHCIGLHSYEHKSAWLSLPWKTMKEFKKSIKIFNNNNIEIKYFRPPWGTFNLFTLKGANKNNLETVLWTVEAFDWRKNNTPTNISSIINNKVKSGDIIVLHDSGGAEGAPRNTIEALRKLIPLLINKGYKFITIEEGLKDEKISEENIQCY